MIKRKLSRISVVIIGLIRVAIALRSLRICLGKEMQWNGRKSKSKGPARQRFERFIKYCPKYLNTVSLIRPYMHPNAFTIAFSDLKIISKF